MLFTWVPGALLLLTATYSSSLWLVASAREIVEIRTLRLDILSTGTENLIHGSTLCTRLDPPEATDRNSTVKCKKTLLLRHEGSWLEGCPREIPRLNPRRQVRVRTNCTWQIANHILRLPAVDYTFKR